MSKAEIKDWRGTLIEVGDVILYAVKHSTSVEVNEAIVKEVGMKPQYYWSDDHLIPVVIAEWQLSSDFYAPNRGELYPGYVRNSGRKIKRVKLTNFEGITVVAKHKVPAFAQEPKQIRWSSGVE